MNSLKKLLVLSIILALCFQSFHAMAGDGFSTSQPISQKTPDGGIMLADVFLVRPLGMVACVLGLLGTVVAAPFAAAAGNMNEVTQKLVGDPFGYTFERPLGYFPGELPAR
ncbi:MAG: hypothetical protein WHS46_03040 [Desulfosoma sp.]